jgi:hypothetical protein
MKKRAKKLLDYDDARSKVAKLESKTSADARKLAKANEEEAQTRIIFESLQNEILQSLPKLNQARLTATEECKQRFQDINRRLAVDVTKYLSAGQDASSKTDLEGQVGKAMDGIRALQIVSAVK